MEIPYLGAPEDPSHAGGSESLRHEAPSGCGVMRQASGEICSRRLLLNFGKTVTSHCMPGIAGLLIQLASLFGILLDAVSPAVKSVKIGAPQGPLAIAVFFVEIMSFFVIDAHALSVEVKDPQIDAAVGELIGTDQFKDLRGFAEVCFDAFANLVAVSDRYNTFTSGGQATETGCRKQFLSFVQVTRNSDAFKVQIPDIVASPRLFFITTRLVRF